MIQEKIDKVAIMWNKTKDPQYKDLWYKLVKEFANVQNTNNFNTLVQRNRSKRRVSTGKTNGSTRMSNVC